MPAVSSSEIAETLIQKKEIHYGTWLISALLAVICFFLILAVDIFRDIADDVDVALRYIEVDRMEKARDQKDIADLKANDKEQDGRINALEKR